MRGGPVGSVCLFPFLKYLMLGRNRDNQIARGKLNYRKCVLCLTLESFYHSCEYRKKETLQTAGHDEVEAYRAKRRATQEKYRKNNREKLAMKQRERREAHKGK